MFSMTKLLSSMIILSGFLHKTSHSTEERLWCYECNTDLRQGHKGDCNDPYTPGAFDLVACPRNESHHCHKSIILYRNILVTVRACVLSHQVKKYCDYGDNFPKSDIECYFCKENACNGSALRCWVCSSNVNVMCNDPMNTTDHQAAFHIRTCDTGHYSSSKAICRKIVKQENGERIVIRQCSTPYHDEIDVVDGLCGNSMSQPGRGVIESCHICSTDLCNSATNASATRLLYIGALISFAYIFQSKYGVF